MIGSKTKARAREEAGAVSNPGVSHLGNAKEKAKSQKKAVVATKPKKKLRDQAEAKEETVVRTQTVICAEGESVTLEVCRMEDMTNIRVITQTETEHLPEPEFVLQTESEAMPVSMVITVTKSGVKVDTGIEAHIKCSAKADDKARIECRSSEIKEQANMSSRATDKTSIVIGSTDEDEENVCSWFWTGEEPSVGSWFWPKEENPFQVYTPPPKIEEEPEPPEKHDFTLKEKAEAWARARFIVLVPLEGGIGSVPPEGNWTLLTTLIETPLGIRPLTKIPPYNGPYFQTLAEVREQIEQREKYGPYPGACRCKSRTFSLEPEEFDELVALLKLTQDPFIYEIATMIMGISPAYPFTQDIVHDVGITVMIENLINNPDGERPTKTLNTVDDSSESLKEPKGNELYIHKICKGILSRPLNSSALLDELKLLVNLSGKFENHHVIANYILDFLKLLNKGSGKTKLHLLKVFSFLSKNQANTRELISAEVLSSLVALFNKNESKANILSVIGIFENINFQFKKRTKLFTKDKFTKSELMSIFREAKGFAQKLQDLAEHNDPEVKDKVIRLILKL